MANDKNILAFESSCDETGVAIYNTEKGALANSLFSQIQMHREFGGVVPELAARDHLKRLPILLKEALTDAQLNLEDIDFIAYTAGPGLLGAVMTGASFARSLAYGLNKPTIPIHHMEGHLLSPFLGENPPEFPFIALLVSGGHTQLLAVKNVGQYTILGETLDDAVGEAFDKIAKIMGLPYPGGPELSKLAEMGDENRYVMPKPMTNRPGMDFSFSGLKTHVRLLIEKEADDEKTRADIAASFQKTVVETIVIKCKRAWKETKYKDLLVSGGVSANKLLRLRLQEEAGKMNKNVYFPPLSLCTDNALMIAYAASYHLQDKKSENDLSIHATARCPLNQIHLL